MLPQISETLREHAATLHFGIIQAIDEQAHMVRVYLEDLDMLTHWVHLPEASTQDDRSHNTIDEGAQVALLLDSRGETGVVLCCINSEVDPPPVTDKNKWHRRFKDGTVLEYDRAAHKLTVDAQAEVKITATGPITLESLQTVTVKALTATVEATTLAKIEAPIIELNAPLVKTGPLLVGGLIQFVPPPPPSL